MTGRRITLGGLAAAGLFATVAVAGGIGPAAAAGANGRSPRPDCGPSAPVLTVHGTGTATGTPDLLTLTLAVSVTGPTADAALSADNADTAAVIAALAAGGVKGPAVQTTGLSIQPQYAKTGALTGFAVYNSVVAKLHDLATAGSVVDAAAGAAGDAVRINSLSFSIQDPRPVQDRARQDAVHQAVSHAASMASAAGEALDGVCKLTDKSSLSTGVRFGAPAGLSVAAGAVPLQPGTQQATAQVTMVYALRKATASRPAKT